MSLSMPMRLTHASFSALCDCDAIMRLMIKFLRKKKVQKRLMLGIVIAIAACFALWGIPLSRSTQEGGAIAGRLGSRNISTGDFIKSYKALRTLLLLQGARGADLGSLFNLERMTWERILLLHAAKKFRIRVSNDEVIQWITGQPVFQRNGVFDRAFYGLLVERQLRMTPREFEETIRESLIIEKTRAALSKTEPVTEDELKNLFEKRYAPKDFRYIVLSPPEIDESAAIDDKETEALYQSLRAFLRSPDSGEPLSLEEARPELEAILRQRKVQSRLLDEARALRSEMMEKGFGVIQTERGYALFEARGFRRGEELENAGRVGAFDEEIAPLEVGEISNPIAVEKGVLLAQLIQSSPPDEALWEKEKENLRSEVETEEARKRLQEFMEGELARLTIRPEIMQTLFPEKHQK